MIQYTGVLSALKSSPRNTLFFWFLSEATAVYYNTTGTAIQKALELQDLFNIYTNVREEHISNKRKYFR